MAITPPEFHSKRPSMSDNKAQLWIQDRGTSGCIVVVAMNETDARRIMEKESWNYSHTVPLQAMSLDNGFKFVNVGDQ